MTITLAPGTTKREARLLALAREKGVTADELVRAAVDKLIAEAPKASVSELPIWPLGAPEAIHRRDIYDDAR